MKYSEPLSQIALYKAWKSRSFEVQVGIHELLGHGSGKLFQQGTPEAEALVSSGFLHPLTQQPVTGPFYAPGATWNSTFGKLSPSYEECRAECTGLYLCLEEDVLQVFGVEPIPKDDTSAKKSDKHTIIHDVTYINWLLMVRAGLTGLEFYTPETKEWRQAHMQARFVILRLLLEAGNEEDGYLCSLNFNTRKDGKPDVQVVLNRDLIATMGKKVIGDFLLKLQTYKSFGDAESGSSMYEGYSTVSAGMLKVREIVMARKEPRKLLVQPHLYQKSDAASASDANANQQDESSVGYKTFPSTAEGLIESFLTRFPSEDPELLALYQTDKDAMKN